MPDLLSVEYWRLLVQKGGKSCSYFLAAVFGVPLIIGLGMSQYQNRGQHADSGLATTIAKVNGEPITQQDFVQLMSRATQGQSPPAGEEYVKLSGNVMNALIRQALIEQEADRRHVHPSAADIDRQIDQEKEKLLGKNGTDAQWESALSQRGMTAADYREQVAKGSIVPALRDSMLHDIKVTDAEAKAQYDEYKLTVVLVPAINPSPQMASMPRKPKPLPDAEAKQRAEELLAKVKSGADIAAIARSDSADPMTSKKGGDTGWIKAQQFGMYGTEFADSVKRTPKGQLTPVIKVPGFMSGYAFARVDDVRESLPKDFNLRQAIDQVKQQRLAKISADVQTSLDKSAKIEFMDPEKKAEYDYAKAAEDEQRQMMAQFGQGDAAAAPTADQVAKEKELADAEMVKLATDKPDDASAAMVARTIVKRKLATASPKDRPAIEEQLITLGQTFLKNNEDHDLRFDLVDEYIDTGKKDLAKAQLDKLNRLLNLDEGYNVDLDGMRKEKSDRERLMAAYRRVGDPATADKEATRIATLDQKINVAQLKQAEDQKRQAEEQKRLAAEQKKRPTAPSASGLSLPSGGTPSAPSPTAPNPEPATAPPVIPAPPAGKAAEPPSKTPAPPTGKATAPTSGAPAAPRR